MNSKEIIKILEQADCLYTNDQVQQSISVMAKKITEDMSEMNPLVLCVMTGGVIPAGHLLTHLNFPLEIDYIHATRYRGDTQGGRLHWLTRPSYELKGRNILIIDDIFDEGITLSEIVDYCYEQGATEVLTAVLVNKLHDRKTSYKVNYIGLETEDRYLFGYGMDYHGYLRNAPGIYAVKGM